ncbi:MAGE-domain-containing protein [Ascobolus immersus RN42]|uniref:MAGE-domain-containing protein n=1 Tax=Ascobolus immersus RN42 TaxID=1160509 RepID=A0A3N4INI0_ASCIM|nr:MAGE-domain-containing protein [Ascobolus immersus RN42]
MAPRASHAGSSTQRRRSGPTQTQQSTQRPTQTQGGSDDEDSDRPRPDGPAISRDSLQIETCARQIVRLALSLHNSRQPLRRSSELVQKIMKGAPPRAWSKVLDCAQTFLKQVFGMQLAELPQKERVTLTQRRNAAASGEGSSSKAWILVSTLSEDYRRAAADILVGGTEKEHAYMTFVTMVVVLIYLNGRMLQEAQLDSAMETFFNMRPESTHPVLGKTSRLYEVMEKQGYIMKVKDSSSGQTNIEYYVGPRAKLEIGEEGAVQFIAQMFPNQEFDDVKAAFKRSVGTDINNLDNEVPDDDEPTGRSQRGGGRSSTQKRGKKRSRREQEEDDDDEEESD